MTEKLKLMKTTSACVWCDAITALFIWLQVGENKRRHIKFIYEI